MLSVGGLLPPRLVGLTKSPKQRMKVKVAARIRPTLADGNDHQKNGPDTSAAEIVRGLDQAAVDVRQAEELEQDHQRQAEREIADHGAEQRVQHLHRAEA